jgi:hypothetical protein
VSHRRPFYSDAAESLGLPRQATPMQIVGAVATTPIATPEVFALLRASRLVENG